MNIEKWEMHLIFDDKIEMRVITCFEGMEPLKFEFSNIDKGNALAILEMAEMNLKMFENTIVEE